MPPIAFRALAATDLPDLYLWLNRPHLRAFFQKKPLSEAGIAEKFGPRLRGEDPVEIHLALLDGGVFGYLQSYRVADHPAWAALIGEQEGIGIDLAILDPGLIGKGLGKAMLATYLREIAFPSFPNERFCFIAHEIANEAGWRTSMSVGFRAVRDFVEEGNPTRLFVLSR
jgi:aminoglycoside 6'-N-acetyltransferase